MKKVMLVFVFLATACSSPPEAPKVDWKGSAEVMNSHAIDWQANQGVIKSDSVTGQWSQVLRGFKPENRLYDDAVFYAVAHSDRIFVETSESGAYFTAKRWLQEHGATGVIEYRKNNDNFGLKTTNIYVAK
ncbi:TPA: cag pathogenicity island Cag12 family protein [Klebsiella pneumoniae]|uniref:cag pathogenicity island Cag12 family protein n=1 Tax=Escherichia coli TaxID=562 RepID=UPI001FAA2974|nr:cag pathogenicity island Cag12 family protein [Escherichia coli]MCI5014584.1 cag pathogenicity island Cag12 family protein [Escherichia coli]